MAKKSIDAVDVSGKRVLIRVDFNVPLEGGKITDDRRIEAALPTIRSVIDRGGKAILMSHLGRPKGEGYEAKYSLKVAAERLSELLNKPVAFPSQDCTDQAAADAVNAMNNGDVLLLENLRFHKGETEGSSELAGKIAQLGDVYVNDAFGTCHRPHASMVGVPRAMAGKPRVTGFLVEKEIRYLAEALGNPAKPFVIVLGGAKVSDKMAAIEHLLPKADDIIVGGAMAYTFLKAQNKDVGDSRVEEDRLDDAKRAIDLAAKLDAELYLPKDHVCGKSFDEDGGGDIEVFQEFGKIGKSLKNSISPDEICDGYGADTLRVYEMSMGPLEASRPWATKDVVGAHRFLQRLWRLVIDENTGQTRVSEDDLTEETLRVMHRTIAGSSPLMPWSAWG